MSEAAAAGFDPARVRGEAHAWLAACARAMTLCADTPRQSDMIAALTARLDGPARLDFAPNPLPCLGRLEQVGDMKLAKQFQRFARDLPWEPSPRSDDGGRDMAICGFNRMFDLGEVVCGLMYVDAGRTYPEHEHGPDETYFLVSGTGQWRWGGHADYRPVPPGNLIYNHPLDRHGIRAGETPVLALYLLCPEDPGELPGMG